MNHRKIQYRVIPTKHDAEFAADMEEVAEACERPYNPDRPLLCMDEQPVQLIKETRKPVPATENYPKRVDHEYERNGTASIFMFTEPLSGRREAAARPRRTETDWAVEVARLLEGRYAECEKVTSVRDNLDTRTKGAFYEAFSPDRARANELSSMIRQCLSGRRTGELETLQKEIAAWSTDVNNSQRGVGLANENH